MLIYIWCLSFTWTVVFLFLFFILLGFKFYSPKLVLAILFFCLLLGLGINLLLSNPQKAEAPKNNQGEISNSAANDDAATSPQSNNTHPSSSQVPDKANQSTKKNEKSITFKHKKKVNAEAHSEEIFPEHNPYVTLKISGLKEKAFLDELAKHLGYSFSRKGHFLVEVTYDGISNKTNNRDLGKEEFNYQAGSLIIKVAEMPCIKKGELEIGATDYRGLSMKELNQKLEEIKLALLRRQLPDIAQKIRDCIPK